MGIPTPLVQIATWLNHPHWESRKPGIDPAWQVAAQRGLLELANVPQAQLFAQVVALVGFEEHLHAWRYKFSFRNLDVQQV